MLYILAGPDDYSRTLSLQEIKRGLGDSSILEMSTVILEGQRVTVEELNHACETVPFLAEKRLVIVSNLIERFDAVARTEKTKGNKEQKTPKDPAKFAECINNIPSSTILVLVENEQPGPTKKNGFFQTIATRAEIRSFPLIKELRLKGWIQKRVTDMGGSISPAAQDVLMQLVGSNLWTMASEIEKLILFTQGRRIEENDVRSMVAYTQDVSIFALIDAIMNLKYELAGETLQQLLQHGAAPAYILFMVDRQFRMIIRAKAMKAAGKPDSHIQNTLGIHNDYALRRTIEQAGRYSENRLKQIYQTLLDTDIAIKTGRYDNELALNLLVADLCQQPNQTSDMVKI